MRDKMAEKYAGYFVVLTLFVSACVTAYEAINRLTHPQPISNIFILAVAGVVGFMGNEITAYIRLRGGHQLKSPALIADGNHARADGFISLSVVVSAVCVALGFPIMDPLIGLAITLVILRITWQSYTSIRES
jgi:cation diffusion facilitator family transporter